MTTLLDRLFACQLAPVAACFAAAAFAVPAAACPAPDAGVTFTVQDPKKPPLDPLEIEKEKLRMKDVEAWKKLQIKSLDQVLDVKKATQPLELPATITEEEKTKFADLLQKAKDAGGGARTGRALREMEKMGHSALILIINQLREIDYKDPTDAMMGMQLNATLQNITMGINTGYVAIELGEPMDPRKAQWNAATVAEWQKAVKTHWPTKEKFDEYRAKRKAKKDAELEGEDLGDKKEEKKDDKKK